MGHMFGTTLRAEGPVLCCTILCSMNAFVLVLAKFNIKVIGQVRFIIHFDVS